MSSEMGSHGQKERQLFDDFRNSFAPRTVLLMLLDKVTQTVHLLSSNWEESARKVFESRVTQTAGSIKRQLGACYELTC